MKAKTLFTSVFVVAIIFSLIIQAAPNSIAADARNYQAGRIIDDGVFTNSNAMTVSNIQSFLNSKVPNCDRYGTKPSELGGGTRAQWLASRGYSTPVTCLKDYYEDPSTNQNNYGREIPSGAISASQIIYNYSQQFSINPQTILATLQKENGLITDEWPTPKQYSEALGFGCPDNVAPGAPACDPSYGSFSAQVYQAARHFRGFINNSPGWYIPFSTGNNSVRWSPNSSCGSSVVTIQNRSTVALYSYTPYQPNQAALNAQYGLGDGCSAYGNRNFYNYFTDWFGSVFGGDPVSSSVRLTSPITTNPANPVAGQAVTVSYTVKNFGASTVNYENSVLQCRYSSVGNCDSSYDGTTEVAAGASKTMTHTVTMSQGASYSLIPYFRSGGLWYRYGVESSIQNSKSLTIPNIPLTSSITISPSQPVLGQPLTVTYSVRNNGLQSVAYQDAVLQCRDQDLNNCDPQHTGSLTLYPGENRTFSHTMNPTADGAYNFTPYFLVNGVWYTYISPQPSLTYTIANIQLTGNISVLPANPVPGQAVTVTYTMKNFGTKSVTYTNPTLQCRLESTENCDPLPGATDIISGGASRTVSFELAPVQSGTYRLAPYYLLDGRWHQVLKGSASSDTKTVNVPRYVADVRIVGGIQEAPSAPIPGDTVTISYKVQNFGSHPAIYQDSILQCRLNNAVSCDSSRTGPMTINPGATQDFEYTIAASAVQGIYRVTPYFMQNGDWHTYTSSTKNIVVPNYTPDLGLIGDIELLPVNPSSGQSATVSYSIKNFGTKTVRYGASILQCRQNLNVNCDSASNSGDSIASGETKTYSTQLSNIQSGSYRLLPYYLYDGRWLEFTRGTASSNAKSFTVQ